MVSGFLHYGYRLNDVSCNEYYGALNDYFRQVTTLIFLTSSVKTQVESFLYINMEHTVPYWCNKSFQSQFLHTWSEPRQLSCLSTPL